MIRLDVYSDCCPQSFDASYAEARRRMLVVQEGQHLADHQGVVSLPAVEVVVQERTVQDWLSVVHPQL